MPRPPPAPSMRGSYRSSALSSASRPSMISIACSYARSARLDRETELRFELSRRDVIVRVRFYAQRQPEHHLRALAVGNDLSKKLELVVAVDHDGGAGAVRGLEVL